MMMEQENKCVRNVKNVKEETLGDSAQVKLKIKFKGIRPTIILKRKNQYVTYDTIIDLFYPYYVFKRFIYNIVLFFHFKRLGYPIIKCQGCGRGYIEWAVKNFYGSEIKICHHCVGWYDFKYVIIRLEKEWLLDADKKIHG